MNLAYNKRKGEAAEKAVCDYLAANGYPHAERRRLSGARDRGDVAGVVGWTIEVKHDASRDLPGWLRELAVEQENTGDPNGVLIVKRVGSTDVGSWFAVVEVSQFVRLMREVDGLAGGEAA